jgi:hypothetical protein
MWSEDSVSPDPAVLGTAGQTGRRPQTVWLRLSALFLLAMGGIHLYLALQGTGGLIGFLFGMNAIGGLVLAIAVLVAQRHLPMGALLSLLFMAGTLVALVLALTVGLFGIREQLDGVLVVPTLIVESIGTIVLVITTGQAFQWRKP